MCKVALLKEEVQQLIYNHKEANAFTRQWDAVDYSVLPNRKFAVLGYAYFFEGGESSLELVETKEFSY